MKIKTGLLLISSLFSFAIAGSVFDGVKHELCAHAIGTFSIEACCRSSLDSCIRFHPECSLAPRLKKFGLWLDTLEGGKPCTSIVDFLHQRYATLLDTVTCPIEMNSVSFVGAPKSPVTVIMYISLSCPLCKRLFKDLYPEVTKGSLANKARLGVKLFTDTPPDIAMLAAQRLGKQSELLLALADVKERVTLPLVYEKAEAVGIPLDILRQLQRDPKLLAQARESREEAIRNGVSVTPTFFINRHRYASFKDAQWIVDAAEFRSETKISEPQQRRRVPY